MKYNPVKLIYCNNVFCFVWLFVKSVIKKGKKGMSRVSIFMRHPDNKYCRTPRFFLRHEFSAKFVQNQFSVFRYHFWGHFYRIHIILPWNSGDLLSIFLWYYVTSREIKKIMV